MPKRVTPDREDRKTNKIHRANNQDKWIVICAMQELTMDDVIGDLGHCRE